MSRAAGPPTGPYGEDVLARPRLRAPAPEVPATLGLVVEERASGFVGDVVDTTRRAVVLRDRQGRRREFPFVAHGFAVDGRVVTLVPAPRNPPAARGPRTTASGSLQAERHGARVARQSRIYVEGVHDAALLEKVWGDDLREAAIVVEFLEGIDDLEAVVRSFAPGPGRRLGVLVDHLVTGSKESRLAAQVSGPHVLVTGHPYVDVWQAVRPHVVGIAAWPDVPHGRPWKEGVCEALGIEGPQEMWRRVISAVRSYADLEQPLVGAVETLLDFLLEGGPAEAGPGAGRS